MLTRAPPPPTPPTLLQGEAALSACLQVEAQLRALVTQAPPPPSPPSLLQGEAALSACLQEEAHLRALVRQLEDDLLRSSGVNSAAADAPASSSSSLPVDVHPPGTPDSGNEAPPGGAVDAGGGASGGLLEIVVGQRDRFRQRALQLEEEKGECEVVGVVFRWLGSSSWRRRGVSDRWLEVFSGWCHSG